MNDLINERQEFTFLRSFDLVGQIIIEFLSFSELYLYGLDIDRQILEILDILKRMF